MKTPSSLVLATLLAAAPLAGGCRRDDGDAIAVVISLPGQHLAGVAKATIEVDYSGAGASILPENGGPSCAFILPGVEGEFADDRKGKLTIRVQGPRAARGPADIAACRMKPGDHDATAADLKKKLTVKVTAAEDGGGKAIDLTAKAAGTKGSGGAGALGEAEIEAAQAEAAKTAAAVAPPPTGTAGGTAGTGVASAAGHGGAAAGGAAPSAATATAAVIPKPSTPPRSVASGPSAAARSGAATAVPTAPPVVDNSNVPGNQDRDPGYDDSDGDNPNLPAYDLEVYVNSPGRLGALQLKITHLGSSGGFIGRNDQTECVALVDAMMAANYSGERLAQVGLINIQGFRTPASVVRCGFRSRESLSANSFLVEVVDASDAGNDPKPVDPTPTAAILSIIPR